MFSCFTITIRLRQSLRRFPGVRFASGECFFVVAARRCSVLFFQKCLDILTVFMASQPTVAGSIPMSTPVVT